MNTRIEELNKIHTSNCGLFARMYQFLFKWKHECVNDLWEEIYNDHTVLLVFLISVQYY